MPMRLAVLAYTCMSDSTRRLARRVESDRDDWSPIHTTRSNGPFKRPVQTGAKKAPVRTDRSNGPFRRPVRTGSVYRAWPRISIYK